MQAFGREVSEPPQELKREQAVVFENLQGLDVLLVEDNEVNQQVAKEILEGAGMTITLANNGQEALDAVKVRNYDAVLMDVQMPVMDGHTASREIRNLKSENRNVPIIAMTAHAMARDREESLAAGMNDHVSKPIDPEVLYRTLEKWIYRTGKRPAQKTGKAMAVSDGAVNGDADEMPDLEGIDVAAGLSRVLGNRKTYRRVLIRFYEDVRDTKEKLEKLVSQGKDSEAKILVHTIKGASGNIGANDLYHAADSLEKWFKAEREGVSDQEYTAFVKELNKVLNSLAKLFQEKVLSAEKRREEILLPQDTAKEIAVRLREALQVGDVGALSQIASELSAGSNASSRLGEEIARLVDGFDFEGVSALADRLKKR
jgi:CheY-like chemotaxis protein